MSGEHKAGSQEARTAGFVQAFCPGILGWVGFVFPLHIAFAAALAHGMGIHSVTPVASSWASPTSSEPTEAAESKRQCLEGRISPKCRQRRRLWVPAGTFCLDRGGKLTFQCLPKLKLDFSRVLKE